jgi:hypothetical protein
LYDPEPDVGKSGELENSSAPFIPYTKCHRKDEERLQSTTDFTATTDASICDTNLINISIL